MNGKTRWIWIARSILLTSLLLSPLLGIAGMVGCMTMMDRQIKELARTIIAASYTSQPGSSGVNVDSYLTWDNRQKVIGMLKGDAERAAQAEAYRLDGKTEKAFERWGVVYRHEFPSYG